MNKFLFLIFLLALNNAWSQDTWKIATDVIDPSNYYGVTIANGMVGIVSAFKKIPGRKFTCQVVRQ